MRRTPQSPAVFQPQYLRLVHTVRRRKSWRTRSTLSWVVSLSCSCRQGPAGVRIAFLLSSTLADFEAVGNRMSENPVVWCTTVMSALGVRRDKAALSHTPVHSALYGMRRGGV